MVGHGFHKFLVINGHGGNIDPNKVTLRALKAARPNLFLAHATYIDFWPQALLDECLTGRIKGIRHACEAETSLMMHLAPELVRADKLRDDGLEPDGGFLGAISNFDEVTENGSFGEATRGTAATGQRLFDSAVAGATDWVRQARAGVSFVSL
jgi:creatinine amidohydrolase